MENKRQVLVPEPDKGGFGLTDEVRDEISADIDQVLRMPAGHGIMLGQGDGGSGSKLPKELGRTRSRYDAIVVRRNLRKMVGVVQRTNNGAVAVFLMRK